MAGRANRARTTDSRGSLRWGMRTPISPIVSTIVTIREVTNGRPIPGRFRTPEEGASTAAIAMSAFTVTAERQVTSASAVSSVRCLPMGGQLLASGCARAGGGICLASGEGAPLRECIPWTRHGGSGPRARRPDGDRGRGAPLQAGARRRVAPGGRDARAPPTSRPRRRSPPPRRRHDPRGRPTAYRWTPWSTLDAARR
jgi:hypothetical protein